MATPVNELRRTILIVDDDVDVAMALARAVRGMGEHQVFVAYSGSEALEMLRIQPVDVLLSDIDMPGIDGVTLVSHARDEALAPVRILLTGNARLETALRAVNRGEVYRYLTKPWSHEQLVGTLGDAFVRFGELSRLSAVDRTVMRLRAASDALEAEHPGISTVEREDDVYVIDRKTVETACDIISGSTLSLVLKKSTSERS